MYTDGIILSIAIPTYNRAVYLDMCLKSIVSDYNEYKKFIEIIVCDNASTDNTYEIVNNFILNGFDVKYFRSDTNKGPDENMINCLRNSHGKYFWIFGDDDVVLEGTIKSVLDFLVQNEEIGMIYLEHYGFIKDHILEKPSGNKSIRFIRFSDKIKFLKRVNIWVTFISAGIFPRSVLEKLDIKEFVGTNLNQVQWVIAAIFSKSPCYFFEGYYIASKGGNTGGYNLFNTFVKNLNFILYSLKKRMLIPTKAINIINYYFLKDFFPVYVIEYKRGRLSNFKDKGLPYKLIFSTYRQYIVFWLVLFPVLILPFNIGKKYFYGLKKLSII